MMRIILTLLSLTFFSVSASAAPTIAYGTIKGIKNYGLNPNSHYVQVHFNDGYQTDIPSCNGVATITLPTTGTMAPIVQTWLSQIVAAYVAGMKIKLSSTANECTAEFVLFSETDLP